MPLDAVTLGGLAAELRMCCESMKIDKVYQPSADTLILTIRGKQGNTRLLLSANRAAPRVCITSASYENPQVPPMFCMLMRKLLCGGIIREVIQPPAERVLIFRIDAADELGEIREKRLVIELISRQANIILVDNEDRIVDCIFRVDGDILAGKRQLLPGMFYRLPPPQTRIDPFSLTSEQLYDMVMSAPNESEVSGWVMKTFAGLSPMFAGELVNRVYNDSSVRFIEGTQEQRKRFADIVAGIPALDRRPWLLLKDGEPKDFSCIEITQYGIGYECVRQTSFSEMLDDFYAERDLLERLKVQSRDMTKLLSRTLERIHRKLETQRQELREALERERLREYGDLLMANLNEVGRGASSVTVVDFYSPEGAETRIPLESKLNAQQNAAKYYKEYTKKKNAEKLLIGFIEKGEQEAKYLESVSEMLSKAESIREISEIRMELIEAGYLKRTKNRKQKKQAMLGPREFISSGGFRIQVGRNNIQNDELTLKMSHKNDIWMHTKQLHGAHVLIRCGQQEPDDDTYTEAAMLAAWYSEAREGKNVPIDYTRARYVKKPTGSRPGMVVYDPYFTMYVTPDGDIAEKLSAKQKQEDI